MGGGGLWKDAIFSNIGLVILIAISDQVILPSSQCGRHNRGFWLLSIHPVENRIETLLTEEFSGRVE